MGDCNTLKSFPNPRDCDPNLDQTKLNDLLPLTIDGVLGDTGSVEGIHAFIYCTKWRSGQVSRNPYSLTSFDDEMLYSESDAPQIR